MGGTEEIRRKDRSLSTVHGEFEVISEPEPKRRHTCLWGERRQSFRWANQIEYRFGPNEKKTEIIHVVECLETWQEIEEGGTKIVEKKGRHLWKSSEPLNRDPAFSMEGELLAASAAQGISENRHRHPGS